MDVRKLRKIIELLHEYDIADFKLKDEESLVQITRKFNSAGQMTHSIKESRNAPNPVIFKEDDHEYTDQQPTFANQNQKEVNIDQSVGPYSDEKVIKSPMVGTYYSAPSPEATDFIKKGQKVESGSVICIIEAMKIMNRIEADKSGIVKEVLVNNGEPVQFGQPLVILE